MRVKKTMQKKRAYKTRIQDAEEFGLFFNCLTRRYLWDFDETLMDLIIRIMKVYLARFSKRTIICSIRDLAGYRKGLFGKLDAEIPPEQKERFGFVLKELVKRCLVIDLKGCMDEWWKKMKIHDLASYGEFTGYGRNSEWEMFPSGDAFEAWVYENHLDEGEAVPEWRKDYLPVKADFLPDFAALCLAAEQYSYGRLSYMPGACRQFIEKNMGLLTDEGLERIAGDIEERLWKRPIHPSGGGMDETKEWTDYANKIRREQSIRKWKDESLELVQKDISRFEEEIRRTLILPENAGEDQCVAVWSRLEGIHRCLLDTACGCADKKERLKLTRWAKGKIVKQYQRIWEKENGRDYVKIGLNLYMRKSLGNEGH